MRLRRPSCFEARGGGDRGKDHLGAFKRVSSGSAEPDPKPLARLSEGATLALGKKDVPGGNALDSTLAKAGCESLSGLSEADEADSWRVVTCHDLPSEARPAAATKSIMGIDRLTRQSIRACRRNRAAIG